MTDFEFRGLGSGMNEEDSSVMMMGVTQGGPVANEEDEVLS